MKRVTLAAVQAMAAAKGYGFHRGVGYFYFIDLAGSRPLQDGSVMTTRLSSFTLAEWEQELDAKIAESI